MGSVSQAGFDVCDFVISICERSRNGTEPEAVRTDPGDSERRRFDPRRSKEMINCLYAFYEIITGLLHSW